MKLVTFAVMFFVACQVFAQSPQSFNYQAIARTADGEIISNQQIRFRVSILEETIDGTSIYSEEHSVTSNQYGLVTFKIGSKESTNGVFLDINWGGNLHFIKMEIKVPDATEYIVLGTSQLLSVPYALHAETTSNVNDADADPSNEMQNISLNGTSLSISDGNTVDLSTLQDGVNDADADPLNELQTLSFSDDSLAISNGNKVFLPGSSSFWSSDGNNIFYNTGKIGVGSITPQSKLEVKGNITDDPNEVLFGVINRTGDTVFAVYQGGVRINVDENTSKASGNRGGFAVGGFSSSKGLTNDYLHISPDSVRIYVADDATKASGNRGGFAVGGFSSSKGTVKKFLDLTPDNYFIGQEAGKSITTGLYNSFIGYQSGISDTSGSENIFMGYKSGFLNTEGRANVFIGNEAGYSNTSGIFNIFLGRRTGYKNTTGNSNIFIGDWAGTNNTTGGSNIFIGDDCGDKNTEGGSNVFIGTYTAYNNLTGNANVFIGEEAGFNNITGNANVFLGIGSGSSNTEGSNNVFIGVGSGFSNISGLNNVFLGQSSGFQNTTGIGNVFIGSATGVSNTTGYDNSFIGNDAGTNNTTGSANSFFGSESGASSTSGYYNVFIGKQSGYHNIDGNKNVFIGTGAGFYELNSERLYIENESADSTQALIYGQFDNNWLRVNNKLGIGKNPYVNQLEVFGTASKSTAGDWLANSDKRIKTDISDIESSFETLLKLRPVKFKYSQEWKDKNPSIEDKFYYNFIAQEYADIFPESVKGSGEYLEGDDQEILQIDTYNAQIVTIKAVQELIKQNQALLEAVKKLQEEIKELKK